MDDFQRQLLRRLDLIIRLQLDRGTSEAVQSTTSIVHRLLDFGLSSSEIASIVGKPINYVTALSSAKRAKGKKSGKGK